MRVLIVEDEKRLAENIAGAVREAAGYAVDLAADGELGLELALQGVYDLLVLDLMLPRLTGLEVLKRLRSVGQRTPILILTAQSGKASTIELLNAGADDYLAKPFDLGELLARIKALIRRGKGVAHPVIRFRDLEIDTLAQTVRRGGRDVDLSPTEYRILEYFLHQRRSVISKEALLEHLYDYNWERHSNVIEAHISNLRRKLDNGSPEPVIETLRGRGYRLMKEHGA